MLFLAMALWVGCSPQRSTLAASPPETVPCAVFPPDNVWNTPIDKLPLDAHSDEYISTIGGTKPLHPDFGAALWKGNAIGIPYVLVSAAQSKVRLTWDYADDSDAGPYPIPPHAPVEGGDMSIPDLDHHMLIVDKDACTLYELYNPSQLPDGKWRAMSGAIFDLKSNKLRPAGLTSSDAAGLPIFPGLVRYDEVASKEIRHALRFTVPHTRKEYVWPGRHYASSLTDADFPPMGQRFRLKASYNIAGFPGDVQVILRALKTYGMFLADNGSPWFISGVPDSRWNDSQLHTLSRIHGSDFEAVDEFSLRVDNDSGQVKTK